MLYHLSTDPYLTHLTPRVSPKANSKSEDIETKRISMAPTIDGCLRALCVSPAETAMIFNQGVLRGNTSEFFDRRFNAEVEKKMKLLSMTYENMEAENLNAIMHQFSDNIVPALPFPVYYVYAPVGKDIMDKIHFVTPEEVYDVRETGEVWITKPIQVVKIGCIYVRYGEWINWTKRDRYNRETHKKKRNPERILLQTYNYVSAPPFWVSKALELWVKQNNLVAMRKKKEQLASDN